MSDHADHGSDDHDHHEGGEEGRVTSPMQQFTGSQVGIGFAVLVVGLVITFAIPLLG